MMAEEKKKASRGKGGQRGGKRYRREREEREFDQKILDLARVTRVMRGGKRMSFRACIALGDKKGRVAIGLGKAGDVTQAITKAARQAEKHMINVPIVRETIPQRIDTKFGAAHVMLKPAPRGTGIRAGGVVRMILDLAGVPNAVSKISGSNNRVNNARAVIKALQSFQKVRKGKEEKSGEAGSGSAGKEEVIKE